MKIEHLNTLIIKQMADKIVKNQPVIIGPVEKGAILWASILFENGNGRYECIERNVDDIMSKQ